MCVMYVGFALLVWIPSVLHAQNTTQPCGTPSLDGGFFLPVLESYPHGSTITYTCDNGFKPAGNGWWTRSSCNNSKWLLTPQCTESPCTEPPKILNAVVINQDYQEMFDVGSEVEYQCKDGYATEKGTAKHSVFCKAGRWTEGPTCIKSCGNAPDVPNSVREDGPRSLKYICAHFYKLEGPETVVCQSDGRWSEVPTCRENFCEMNTEEHPDIENVGVKFIKNGEQEVMKCTDLHLFKNLSVVRCIDGQLHKTRCCDLFQIRMDVCRGLSFEENILLRRYVEGMKHDMDSSNST